MDAYSTTPAYAAHQMKVCVCDAKINKEEIVSSPTKDAVGITR